MSLKKVIAISSVSLASVGILAGCGSSEASNVSTQLQAYQQMARSLISRI